MASIPAWLAQQQNQQWRQSGTGISQLLAALAQMSQGGGMNPGMGQYGVGQSAFDPQMNFAPTGIPDAFQGGGGFINNPPPADRQPVPLNRATSGFSGGGGGGTNLTTLITLLRTMFGGGF